MPELLSFFLPGAQLSKTKQEEESLGRFMLTIISFLFFSLSFLSLEYIDCWSLCGDFCTGVYDMHQV